MPNGFVGPGASIDLDSKVAKLHIIPPKAGAQAAGMVTINGEGWTVACPTTFEAATGKPYRQLRITNNSLNKRLFYWYVSRFDENLPRLTPGFDFEQGAGLAPLFTKEVPGNIDSFVDVLANVNPVLCFGISGGQKAEYFIQNLGPNDVYLGNGSMNAADIVAKGIQIPALGGNYEGELYVPRNIVGTAMHLYLVCPTALQVSPDGCRVHYRLTDI